MSIKTRYQAWTEKHDLTNEDVTAFALLGGTLAAVVAVITAAAVHDSRESKKIDEWSRSQYEAGRHVYELANGALIATDQIHVY